MPHCPQQELIFNIYEYISFCLPFFKKKKIKIFIYVWDLGMQDFCTTKWNTHKKWTEPEKYPSTLYFHFSFIAMQVWQLNTNFNVFYFNVSDNTTKGKIKIRWGRLDVYSIISFTALYTELFVRGNPHDNQWALVSHYKGIKGNKNIDGGGCASSLM